MNRVLMVTAVLALSAAVAGCASPSPMDRALQEKDAEIARLERETERRLRECRDDPDCRRQVHQEHLERSQELFRQRLEIIEDHWNQSREEAGRQRG